MILNTCAQFQFNTCNSKLENLENIHLHSANLNIGIVSPNRAVTDPKTKTELLVLLCLIGLMIINAWAKFQSHICNSYLDNLENIYLHVNLNVGIQVQKGQ